MRADDEEPEFTTSGENGGTAKWLTRPTQDRSALLENPGSNWPSYIHIQ
jgi:hypothetical protein